MRLIFFLFIALNLVSCKTISVLAPVHSTIAPPPIKQAVSSLNIPIEITIAQIKSNFKLEKIKEIQIKDSLFFSVLGNEKLGVTIQGYREEYNEKGEKIKIPHISFSVDIDYFDNILKKLIEKIKTSIKP